MSIVSILRQPGIPAILIVVSTCVSAGCDIVTGGGNANSNCSIDGSKPKIVPITAGNAAADCTVSFGSREAALWEPEEWGLKHPFYSGNPFDMVATVTFKHQGSSQSRTTEMFYDGDDIWKFRFTGIQTGTWTFSTSSPNLQFDGHTGTVEVSGNPDLNASGFLTNEGNMFAVQVGGGQVEGFLLNIYQIDDDKGNFHKSLQTHVTTFDNNTVPRMRKYVRHARERGFTAVAVMLTNNLLEMGAYAYNDTFSRNPDLETFRVLDDIIATAREEEMRVYFWRWGDEWRKWTPVGLPGGINGKVDHRVTRYFAARLGPLPGWSMGYGFDLAEDGWISKPQLQTWVDRFQEWLGWEHLLSARGHDLERSSGSINGYVQMFRSGNKENIELATDQFPSYSTLVEDLSNDANTPHLLEERNVLGRWNIDAADTRRLMWRTAMARGMGGWYGHFNSDPVFSGDRGYPNPEELRAHRMFWEDRFLLSFERANGLTDGRALTSRGRRYVFYKEGTSSIQIDLSGAENSLSAVAVDTQAPYEEIALGMLDPTDQSIELPHFSDWAIAVGNF